MKSKRQIEQTSTAMSERERIIVRAVMEQFNMASFSAAVRYIINDWYNQKGAARTQAEQGVTHDAL